MDFAHHGQYLDQTLAVVPVFDGKRVNRRLQRVTELSVVGRERRFGEIVYRVVDQIAQLEHLRDVHGEAQPSQCFVEGIERLRGETESREIRSAWIVLPPFAHSSRLPGISLRVSRRVGADNSIPETS